MISGNETNGEVTILDNQQLIKEAIIARKSAYAPYSNFKVGAALLSKSGKLYHGCNIENAAYGPSNCAERTAFFKAVSEGEREFTSIAIIGGYDSGIEGYAFPCGVCRQVMMEFCDPKEFVIITAKSEDEFKLYSLNELLPEGFGPASL